MRRILPLLFISLLTANFLSAQTIFWTENFGTGCTQLNSANGTVTGNGTWAVTHVAAPAANANQWFVSAAEAGVGIGNCGNGCLNNAALTNRTLHVGNVSSSPAASFFCPTGDCGAAYDAGGFCGSLGCVSVNDRAESPLINCTGQNTITLNFSYIEAGDPGNDFMEVMYSANGGVTWNSLTTPAATNNSSCGSGQGFWTTFSIALPASANNNPNVKIGFRWQNNDDGAGNDPSIAVDDITLSAPSGVLPVVTITPTPANDSLCQNATLTLNGSATNGPITAWSWSVTPSAGVVFNPNATTQNVTATFTTSGTYTFTLQATNGSGNATTTQTITVLPSVIPTLTITASPVNPVCAGTAINFTATATNGGTTPAYQWQVNSVNAGSNSPNFNSSTLNNNDVVTCTVTSNAQCVSPATASNSYTVQITPTVVPSVTIVPSATIACAGQPLSFTATPTNGGITPAYQWQVNGSNQGTNSTTYTSTTLATGDVVTVILTSNANCANPVSATSNSITVTITATVSPTVTITANPGNPICAGQTVSFTATPTHGGGTPIYQWQINAVNAGTNSPNFSSSTLVNGDVVSVTLTSNASCVSPATASNSYTIIVSAPQTPSVTITPNPASTCTGGSITFTTTPTNGGGLPAYQWQVNGANAGTNNSTFTLTNASAGEQISVVLTSNAGCVTTNTAHSNTVTVMISPAPTLTVIQGNTSVCPNATDTIIVAGPAGSTFTWTPSAGLSVTNNDTVVATNVTLGVHTYYVTCALSGCSTLDSVKVTVTSTLTATTGLNQTICTGQHANLSVTGGSSWSWIPTSSLSCTVCANPIASPTATTIYTVVATSGGCTDTITQTVTVVPKASASFNTSVITEGIPQTVLFTNTSLNASNYFWTLGDNSTSILVSPTHIYNAAGTYSVTLIAYGANGCNDTITTSLLVMDSVGITVPNIFTPNGDNINDVWAPSVHGAVSFNCTVYNRWGLLVYTFAGAQDYWDGYTTSGVACQDGTYFYILTATDRLNKSYNLKGYLTLIR